MIISDKNHKLSREDSEKDESEVASNWKRVF